MIHNLQLILTSEPLSRRLHEKGLRFNSCFWYQPYYETMAVVGTEVKPEDKKRRVLIVGQKPPPPVIKEGEVEEKGMCFVSALTVAEIGRIIPPTLQNNGPNHRVHELTIKNTVKFGWSVGYVCLDCGGAVFEAVGPHLTECMGEVLEFLLDKKLLMILPVKN